VSPKNKTPAEAATKARAYFTEHHPKHTEHPASTQSPDNGLAVSAYELAHSLWRRGWSIIPADTDRKQHDSSLITGWRQFQSRRASDLEVSDWRAARGFAVVCGALSGVVVLDVDPGGEKYLRGKHLPPTPTAQTPRGGCHYFFRHPGKRIKTLANVMGAKSRVDMRGDGGIALLPGSVGRNWLISPFECELANVPEWLLPLVAREPAKGRSGVSKHSNVYVTGFTLPVVTRSEGGRLTGDELRAYADRTDIGIEIANFLGLPTDGLEERGSTAAFRCILPGHEERSPSASLYVHPKTGAVLYRDWHGRSGYSDYALADVMAARCFGRTMRLSPSQLATWQIRLLVEVGRIAPYPVVMRPLPEGVSDSTRRVYEGFRLLLGCKWRYSPSEPTAFSRDFARAWCGLAASAVQEAIRELHVGLGIIRIVGQHRNLRLWLPAGGGDA
jgi:hypothetical protein